MAFQGIALRWHSSVKRRGNTSSHYSQPHRSHDSAQPQTQPNLTHHSTQPQPPLNPTSTTTQPNLNHHSTQPQPPLNPTSQPLLNPHTIPCQFNPFLAHSPVRRTINRFPPYGEDHSRQFLSWRTLSKRTPSSH